MKKVFKKKRSNMSGALNVRARAVSRRDVGDLTPGVVTDRFDVATNRSSKKKQQTIIENRRRRH